MRLKPWHEPMTRFALLFLISALYAPLVIAAPISIDTIVAIVDEDVITRREVNERLELIRLEFAKNNRRLPETKTLNRQLMELMINESILIQKAKSRGIKITDGQLNQAMQNIARDNKKTLSAFRETLIADGIDYNKYRESVRKEIILSTLRGQYTARTATISDAELNEFINRNGDDLEDAEYRIAHILIALPDAASPEQISVALETANQVLARLQQGIEFDQLANEFSSGATALKGGDLGWRKRAEIPSLFTDAVLKMQPGDFVGPLRSPSGFHIVTLNERRAIDQVLTNQTRSRHILIRANEIISEEAAKNRLIELRRRIINGEDFDTLAKLHSVDYASGAEGGDIGWMFPGATVKQYETVADSLPLGEISEPFQSSFGWHIVEVTGRRTLDETVETKRKKIREQLLRQKQREVFDTWQQRLRDEAYVILSDA
ncbi:MAG: peptidyl-prolyl cis-trans isomerase SurA [Gammaproteobacteria bacterium]|jgi:peptidyl-prolyl cis-trans isomerase SurA